MSDTELIDDDAPHEIRLSMTAENIQIPSDHIENNEDED